MISDGLQMGIGPKLSGALDKDDSSGANSGNVTLTAVQTYTGATNIEAGTLTLGTANVLASSSGVELGRVGGGATATLALGANNAIASLASEQSNTSTVALGAFNLTLTGSANTTYYGSITGTGGLTKTGSGTQILDGVSSFTGTTTLSGGVLEIGDASYPAASISGPVVINSGGTLSGHGSATGPITVNAGGALRPGGTIGTLTTGSVTFTSGATYTDEVSGTTTSLLASTGAVTLQSGTHFVVIPDGAAGSYARVTSFGSVITAAGGVNGTFADATSSVSGFTPILGYGANAVSLTLVKTDLTPLASTPNQLATATALSGLPGSAIFNALALQSDATVTQALNLLSGEVHATIATALLYDSAFLADAIQAHNSSDALINVWADGNGRWAGYRGDGNAAAANSSMAGFAAGADIAALPTVRLGAAAGYSHDSLGLAARASTAKVDTAYAGGYADVQKGPLSISLVASYAWHTIGTARAIAFTGFSQAETASYGGNTLNLFGETSWHVELPPLPDSPFSGQPWLEPFVSLSHGDLRTDGFSESAGAAALNGASANRQVNYVTMGPRFGESFLLDNGISLDPMASVGWEHALSGTAYGANVTFAAGGTAFPVLGPPLARDALATKAGASMSLNDALKLELFYAERLSSLTTEHGVTANLRYAF